MTYRKMLDRSQILDESQVSDKSQIPITSRYAFEGNKSDTRPTVLSQA